MKVLQITTSSKGGAGIAALRLHDALRVAGVSSAYLSKDLTINFEGQPIQDSFFDYRPLSIIQRVSRKLSRILGLRSKTAQSIPNTMNIDAEMISKPFSDYQLHEHSLVKEATILNLHWVGLILDYPTFFPKIAMPIVWTLHDMNPFSGLFHYRADALRNEATISALDKSMYAQKQKIIANSTVRAIVSPTNWLLEEAQKSSFFPSNCVYQTIANSIDIPVVEKHATSDLRKAYQLQEDALVFLVVAYDLKSHRKGMDLLLGALQQIEAIPITILTVGKGVLEVTQENCTIIPLGTITSQKEMFCCYTTADAFILPSREDNLPNVMLESFAAGTPVISFAHGGMLEHITHGLTGVLATELSSNSLADAITDFAEQKHSFDTNRIKEYAHQNFSPEKQASSYLDVYNAITSI